MYLGNNIKYSTETILQTEIQEEFYNDVIKGLSKKAKQLPSKYFYDKQGDRLFQQIMQCNDYYLTRSELEILEDKTAEIAVPMLNRGTSFDLIELGTGDGAKTYHLLKYLMEQNAGFRYLPVDISANILSVLKNKLNNSLPKLEILDYPGDYFEALEELSSQSSTRKVVLMLGANVCNMEVDETYIFCKRLHQFLLPGDMVLMGFDLKKNPQTILLAYNDHEGITRKFNLNLLKRINRELQADFDLGQFEHFQTYDPQSGACRSFLVSLSEQQVKIGNHTVSFESNEQVAVEISQKYALPEIEKLAIETGFQIVQHTFDSKNWFTTHFGKFNNLNAKFLLSSI